MENQSNKVDFNLNQSECQKSVEHFGYTEWHNICQGTVTKVSWGFGDYTALVMFAMLVAVIFWVFKRMMTDF